MDHGCDKGECFIYGISERSNVHLVTLDQGRGAMIKDYGNEIFLFIF